MNYFEPTKEQVECYDEWVAARPEHMRELCGRFKPWELYRLKDSGHLVYVVAFDEHPDGPPTLKVNVESRFNVTVFMDRTVFGVSPDDLETLE